MAIEGFNVSVVDRLALLLVISMIAAILVIASWSTILLAIGMEEAGGPLVMIARICWIHLLV